jgi:hypothetical protein
MNKEKFSRRFLFPILMVLFIVSTSYFGYYGARQIPNENILLLLTKLFGSIYFLGMVIGPLYIWVVATLRGASLTERVLATLLIPFLWMTKGVINHLGSHPVLESLYWYFNPLYIWITCLLAMHIGLGTTIARFIQKRQGYEVKVISFLPLAFLFGGFLVFAGIFAWGQGENIYSLFLECYRYIFSPGA